ncbi:MAG: Ig-like domain repeat protein [Propionibacteriaceae bacterium]|jgi:enterochelin esterase-like enzyme|nr:Ig-like domain repeat protein [Propionibacteriaceae bacterium]
MHSFRRKLKTPILASLSIILGLSTLAVVDTAHAAPTLSIDSDLYCSVFTTGKSTLKEMYGLYLDCGADSKATFTLSDPSLDNSKIDSSNATVTLVDGDGYYADEYIFTATSLPTTWTAGSLEYTIDGEDLQIDSHDYATADANSGREWSCLGGDGHGNYWFNLKVSGIEYDGSPLPDQVFRLHVYVYGYNYTSDAISLYPTPINLTPVIASLSTKATAPTPGAAPIFTWVGDAAADKPNFVDRTVDDIYVTWPTGVNASAVTASDVTITLKSAYGDTKVLTASDDYVVNSSAGETQIAIKYVNWAFIPVYSTMTVSVDTSVLTGTPVTSATQNYNIASVWVYEAQQGGGGTTVDGTVTAYSFYGLANLTSVDQLFSAATYTLRATVGGQTVYYAADGTLTTSAAQAKVYDASGATDSNTRLIGNTLFVTSRANRTEHKVVDGELITFTKVYSGGRLLTPVQADPGLLPAPGYAIPWGTSNWITHEKWAWQPVIGEGWTGVDVQPYTGRYGYTVDKGATQQFTPSDGSVVWSIVGTVNPGTTITADGLLTISRSETAAKFGIVATSTTDTSSEGVGAIEITVRTPSTPLNLGPAVTLTSDGPTGYQATFRYQAPSGVSQVNLYGEWSFSDPTLITGIGTGERKLGDDWEVGDIPGPDESWISVPMNLGADGIWTYTMSLPPGTYSYGFTHDCVSGASGCTRYSDPANEPWSNQPAQAGSGLPTQTMSQIYVPKNPAFPTTGQEFLAPVAPSEAGTLTWLQYADPDSTNPVGYRLVAVYLPVDYDPARAVPYPTLYITHGSGGNSTDWYSQGQAQVVLDNAIADAATQGMIVVSTDNAGIAGDATGYADDFVKYLIPAVESAYNVSTLPADRAFAGYSAGSARSTALLQNYGTKFGYFGIWSRRDAYTEPTAEQWENMKSPYTILLLCGISDYNRSGVSGLERWTIRRDNYLAGGLTNVVSHCGPGVHGWDVWRGNLNEFVRTVAFKATGTEVTAVTGAKAWAAATITATVTPKSTSNAAASGTVEFYLGSATGTKIGEATVGADGKATVNVVFEQAGAQQIVAVYSGDNYLNTSTSEAYSVTVASGTDPSTAAAIAEAKSGLEALIAGANAIKTDGYTAATVGALTAAVTAAKTVAADPNATVAQLQAAIASINTAIAALAVEPPTTPKASKVTTTSVKVTAKAFKKASKPKITVTVKLSSGVAKGKIAVYVNGKKVKTVKVINKNTVIQLPKKYSKAIKVKAKYLPKSTAKNGTAKTSATVKVKVK